jgi:hypothetical protein
MSPAKSSIQSIDLDDLERKLRNFVDPAPPNVSAGDDPGARTARLENFRVANANKRGPIASGEGASPSMARTRLTSAAAAKITDLDAVEKELREVAASVLSKSTAASKSDETLKQLAQIVGRDMRADAAGRERADEVPTFSVSAIDRKGSQKNAPSEIFEAYQGRAARASISGESETRDAGKPRKSDSAELANRQATASREEIIRRFDHEARTFLAGAAGRLDGIERVTAEPEPSAYVVRQSVVLRSLRSLALPLLLLALGTGTAVVMLSPVGERPRGRMKETQLQAPIADPGSRGESSALSTPGVSGSPDPTNAGPAKSAPLPVVDALPAAASTPALTAPAPSTSSPPIETPSAPSTSVPANVGRAASIDPSVALPQTDSPPTASPAAPAAAPPPVSSTMAAAPAVSADSPDGLRAAQGPALSLLGTGSAGTALSPSAPTGIAGADQTQTLPAADAKASTPTVELSTTARTQLPDAGSAPTHIASAPRADPTPSVASPPATNDSSVASAVRPPGASGVTGEASPPPAGVDEAATNPQADASRAAKAPAPNTPRAIQFGKATGGANGEGTSSGKAPTATTGLSSETSVSAAPLPPSKAGAASATGKPVLTRPAKPAALIATSHLPPAHSTRSPSGASEPRPVDDKARATIGAPLMITPSEAPEPTVEASAAPVDGPQTVETSEKTIEPGANSTGRGGPLFSLRLASSLSEIDARATLSQLQKEFPGALQNGSVTRDNLGRYGVFYRVKVGPLSRETAERVCSRLRAAGRKCVLARG